MRAKDVMNTNIFTINASAKIYDLTKLLTEQKINSVPVCNDAGQVIGVVGVAELINLKKNLLVRDIMNPDLPWVDAATPVDEIIPFLEDSRLKRLPVFENGCLVGIISRADIIRAMAGADHNSRDLL